MDFMNLTTSETITTTTAEVLQSLTRITFSWYDYTLFVAMLLSSAIIGIYFGCFGSKQSTKKDYLLGGKTMKPFPVALSLVASNVSGVSLLGVPSDVYRYGATYWLSTVAIYIVVIVTLTVYLPVFYELQLTSSFEYLNRRFDSNVRSLASFIFIISMFLHLPLTIYIPALAFSEATNIGIYYVTPLVCAVCIFYTTIGGLKAVVWTDTLQLIVTVLAMGSIFYLGIVDAGGVKYIFEKSKEGHRLDIDFDLDPSKRDTFWTMVIGWTMASIAFLAVGQSNIQKFLSIPTWRGAKTSLIMYIFGLIIVKSVCVITGLIMFAKYFECDPFETGSLKYLDQLLPYYVMDVAGDIPGLPGLFIAGIFCAGLSTLSAYLNCLSGIVYEDFLLNLLPKNLSDKAVSNILKLLVVIIGAAATCLVFVVEHLGGLFAVSMSIGGVYSGPTLGLFTLGMLFPKANKMGALWGAISSFIFMFFLLISAQLHKYNGSIFYAPKPIYTHGCDFDFIPRNSTIFSKPTEDDVFILFRISHYYYTLVGFIITISVGYSISLFTQKKGDPPVKKELLSPVVRFLVKNEKEYNYYSAEKAYNIANGNNIKENTV